MIFAATFLPLVLSGEKTQTRRRVASKANGVEVPCAYRPGRTYTVQPGRGQKAVGRIRVLEVSRVRLEGISKPDARAEGFASPDAFLAWWQRQYGTAQGECWRIRFEAA